MWVKGLKRRQRLIYAHAKLDSSDIYIAYSNCGAHTRLFSIG